MCSRILISLEGRLKSHPSFTSLLQNNLFRETVFSLLQLVRKQENRDYRMESPFQHYSVEVNKVKLDSRRRRRSREESGSSAPSCIRRPDCYSVTVERSTGSRSPPTSRGSRPSSEDLVERRSRRVKNSSIVLYKYNRQQPTVTLATTVTFVSPAILGHICTTPPRRLIVIINSGVAKGNNRHPHHY
jgi:hypothetical protein